MDKMEIYNKARVVPNEAKKEITAGRLKGFTDINPMWRIKRLTELFGACGVGWWYEVTRQEIVDDAATRQRAAFVDVMLYYIDQETGEASHGIFGTGGASFLAQERNGAYLSDECYKMALTDALSVAAKALGVGADVYYARDCDKYTPTPKKEEPPKLVCEDCSNVILPYEGVNGKTVSVTAHIARTEEKWGKSLCHECAMKRIAEESNADAAN